MAKKVSLKEKEKRVEKLVNEHAYTNLVKYIIAETFARHAKMSEEEFLKEIKFDQCGATEEEAIRVGIYNILVEAMQYMLKMESKMDEVNEIMKVCLGKGEKNGK